VVISSVTLFFSSSSSLVWLVCLVGWLVLFFSLCVLSTYALLGWVVYMLALAGWLA
jgi:hypothetical protein